MTQVETRVNLGLRVNMQGKRERGKREGDEERRGNVEREERTK